jgi:hypothetical protein
MNHTSCKDCVWAIYRDNTQILCDKNLLKKYEKLNVSIREVYDDEKEFYVIEGRKCIFYRNKDWIPDQLNGELWDELANQKLSQELKLQYSAIIYINKEQEFKHAKSTVLSLLKTEIPPHEIIIVYQDNSRQISTNTGLPEYSDDLNWCQQNLSETKFRIEYPTNNPSLHEMLNIAISKVKNAYLLVQAGQLIHTDYIQIVNNKIVSELLPITVAKHTNGPYHGLFVFKRFHDYVGGFGEKSVQEKVEDIIGDANETLIYDSQLPDQEIQKLYEAQKKAQQQCSQMFLTYEQI